MKIDNKIKWYILLLFVTIILYFTWGMWFGVIGALVGSIVVGLTSNGSWLKNTSLRGNRQNLQEDTLGGLDSNMNCGVDITLNALRVTGIPVERGSITQDGKMNPAGNAAGGEEVYQKPLDQQGYCGGNKYREQRTGTAVQDSIRGVATLPDINHLKSFINNRGQEPIDGDQLAQLAIRVYATLQNHGKVPLSPKIDQQVNELAQQYRQEYPERNQCTTTAVSELPRNPHSKLLFDTYAKEALDNSGQGWTVESNKVIAENMIKNGVRPQRVEEALKHSPVPVENAYYFVKDIKNNPELQVVQQERGIARVLK